MANLSKEHLPSIPSYVRLTSRESMMASLPGSLSQGRCHAGPAFLWLWEPRLPDPSLGKGRPQYGREERPDHVTRKEEEASHWLRSSFWREWSSRKVYQRPDVKYTQRKTSARHWSLLPSPPVWPFQLSVLRLRYQDRDRSRPTGVRSRTHIGTHWRVALHSTHS